MPLRGLQVNKNKKKKLVQVLGPVENLESYVKADWWKEIFNANYLRTDGDVVNDPAITTTEIETFLSLTGIVKEDVILDLCCGQGRHTFEMAGRGFKNLHGLDRSHYLISRAKIKNRDQHRAITFREGDARALPYEVDFFDSVMIMGNSFGYFESLHDDVRVLREVSRVLKPGGKLLLDITDGSYMRRSYEPRSWEWIDRDYFVCRERSLSEDGRRLVSREVITHVKKGVVADQFYAERLYTQESITELLMQAGFRDIEIHQNLEPDSKRNQDLGMMAKRMIITSSIRKDWTPKKAKKKTRKTIAVLMGDPGLDDMVKPGAIFSDNDHHTINELKNALSGISEYNFIYKNHHGKMLQELVREKERYTFVFNLCDEGFNNQASKELHVPAILEILGIPYTGGTPQCLAFCYDKSLVRGIAKELDLPVPEAFTIRPEDLNFFDLPIHFPVIVKPNLGDSSFGITRESVCDTVEDLEQVIGMLREKIGHEQNILVEEFLTGKDLSVGIIGNMPDNYTVLPIIEEDYSSLPDELPRICGYEAKWDPDSPYWKIQSVPAELPEETSRFLVASCLKMFARLQCRDYARFDWRLDRNGTPRLLEVNPNPGWCWDGHLARMCAMAGLSYRDMLNEIIKSGEKRIFGTT